MMYFGILLYQLTPMTFKEAFAGVQDVLRERIDISHGLLTKLLSKGVLLREHIEDIEVCVYCTVPNGCKC